MADGWGKRLTKAELVLCGMGDRSAVVWLGWGELALVLLNLGLEQRLGYQGMY